jgi:hypothetical protein
MKMEPALINQFSNEISRASTGDYRVDTSTSAALDKWFPSIQDRNNSMNGWFIVMKYRPHLSGNSLDKQQRRNVELEVRGDGGGVYRHPKMKAKEVPPIIVNDIRDGDKYAYAHIPLTTPLRLDVPFDQQREVIEEIVNHTAKLMSWYRSAILNVDF